MLTNNVFDRARAVDIGAASGVTLYRAGKRWRSECPLCGSGKGKKGGGPFSVDQGKRFFKCWSCNDQGDVIDLDMRLRGGTRIDAARRLAGDISEPLPAPAPPVLLPESDEPTFSEVFAARIWAEAQPARGTIVQSYLMSRGIFGSILLAALKHIRFHPHVYHSGGWRKPVVFPGMILRPVVPGPDAEPIETGGIHVTYLARDGSGKAPVPAGTESKKMWGPQGLDGVPGGVWLTPIDSAGELLVGEGAESTLSMAILHNAPARLFATLSLNRMQGGWLADKYGRLDPDVPKPDLDSPPATWPMPEASPWPSVIIGVDHDMKPIDIRVRKPLGGTVKRQIGPSDRARICATLACEAWRRIQPARVLSVAPPLGQDFNDKLRRSQAA